MMTHDDIVRRFTAETAQHEMTVLHDDGLYRHIQFRHTTPEGQSSIYGFDLITIPGTLIFQGDGDGYMFRRIEDMFQFFRGPVGDINPGYWAEKVTDGYERLQCYHEEIFKARVLNTFIEDVQTIGVPKGTGRALRERVLGGVDDCEDDPTQYEANARQALADFEHSGYRFDYTDNWDFQDWHWWYLWTCHAIVWGIAYYDTGKRPTVPLPAAAKPRRVPAPKSAFGRQWPTSGPVARNRRPIVDVQLPEPAGNHGAD